MNQNFICIRRELCVKVEDLPQHLSGIGKITSKVVTFACTGIILGCGTYENKVHQTQELNTELKLLLDREEALYQKYRPLDLNDEDESNK